MRNVAKRVTLSLLSALALTACGWGESGQNTKQPNPEQPSSNLTTSTLEGTAADNIIRHGEFIAGMAKKKRYYSAHKPMSKAIIKPH